jgi:hypothetical protein
MLTTNRCPPERDQVDLLFRTISAPAWTREPKRSGKVALRPRRFRDPAWPAYLRSKSLTQKLLALTLAP